MKKVYVATELGRFFVTGPLDAVNMPSHFYCRLCRKNVSMLTHGHHEVLQHFQGRRHYARDQRLRLETPGWRVLDFQGNPLTEDELEWQREKIQKGLRVVRDREHPFAEDLISDEAGVIDPQLPVLVSQKNSFLFPARLLAVLHSSLLLRKVLRSRGQGEVVVIAVKPQYSTGDTSNNLTVYLYKLLTFRILVIV